MSIITGSSTECGASVSGIHNGRGILIADRIFREAMSADAPRIIPETMWTDYQGSHLIRDKGEGTIRAAGIELYSLYAKAIAADNIFGETFDGSRKNLEHTAATQEEINLARKNLGRRIFQDLAYEYARCGALGAIVGDAESSKAWHAVFDTSEIPQHLLDVKLDEKGNVVIGHIWGIVTSGRREEIEKYTSMLEMAKNRHSALFAEDVGITLIVAADSQIADMSDGQRQEQGIYVVELPILRSQLYSFGDAMLLDETPTADSATRAEVRRRILADSERQPVQEKYQRYRDGSK